MSLHKRLQLALERITYEQGFDFEHFSLKFLADEFPDLRPVGGMHDGARDAFLHTTTGQPDVVVQCSVTKSWANKIRGTVSELRKNGSAVRELIYCSPLALQGAADTLKAELRKDGVSLDVRDRGYFGVRADVGSGQKAASEELARLVVDPLLAERGVLARASASLSREEERVATTYLQLELAHREPSQNLTKLSVEALVKYCLREASPEAVMTRATIRTDVAKHMQGADPKRLSALVDSAIRRLVLRDQVKHHQKLDSFTLSHSFREEMKRRITELLSEEEELARSAKGHVEATAKRIGIKYAYPLDEVARDVITVLDTLFYRTGKMAAVALAGKGEYAAHRDSLDHLCETLMGRTPSIFEATARLKPEQFLDIVPSAVERMLGRMDPSVTKRLRTLSDAYCLQFLLQQSPDVQQAVTKLLSGVTLLVDTTIVIQAMSERAVLPEHQRMTRLLKAARAMGCALITGDDVINELDTHLDRIRYNYRVAKVPQEHGTARFATPLLEGSWQSAQRDGLFPGSFEQFITQFKGDDSPQQDLVEYLKHELSIEYRDLQPEVKGLPPEIIGDLLTEWRAKKPRRPWVDEAAFETLVMHDVTAFSLVEAKRRATRGDATYGHRWWWLVQDGTALRFDRQRHSSAPGGCVCMSPDFFVRYLSLAPKTAGVVKSEELLPASAIHIASLGLVPDDLRDEARRIYETTATEPEYLRVRKLRDLMNRAVASAGQDLNQDEDEQGAATMRPTEARG